MAVKLTVLAPGFLAHLKMSVGKRHYVFIVRLTLNYKGSSICPSITEITTLILLYFARRVGVFLARQINFSDMAHQQPIKS